MTPPAIRTQNPTLVFMDACRFHTILIGYNASAKSVNIAVADTVSVRVLVQDR